MTPKVMKTVDGGTPSHRLKVWANPLNSARMNRPRPKCRNRRRNLGIPRPIAVEIIGGFVGSLQENFSCACVSLEPYRFPAYRKGRVPSAFRLSLPPPNSGDTLPACPWDSRPRNSAEVTVRELLGALFDTHHSGFQFEYVAARRR